MSWPLASHFSAMLQNPRVAFRDSELQRATIEKNEQNQPRPWAGAFAVVYKGVDPEGRGPLALRVFTTESSERRERYDHISAYLKGRRLKCLVDFEYRDRAIRSAGDGKWYPLIVMDWVQGDTLFQWLRARCREGHRDAIAQVAERWLEAVQELADAQVAHGDLQHANIMVTPAGEVRLVDYDGMCVPSLVGRRNLEVGIEPYQHPGRNATTLLSLDLDNFSALLIYVALKTLAIQPALWMKYVEQPGYDKLLFRREDFVNPSQSPLYYDMIALGNADLRAMAERLWSLAQGRMEEVPMLGQLVNSYAQVERLLVARQWNAAVDLLNRRGHFRDAPAALQPLIQQAYEYVCRQQAWAKFSKIPAEVSEPVDRQLVESWNEPLFGGFPAAEAERARVNDARKRVEVLDRLRLLVQRTAGKISVAGERGLAALAAQLPGDYPHSLHQRTELARRRAVALARLERSLTKTAGEADIVAAYRAVVEAKCEGLVKLDWGMRIALAEQRLPIFKALAKIPRNAPLDERDRSILAVWDEKLLADCPEVDKWRPIYQMAVVRREVLKRLQAAIDAHDDAGVVQWGQKRCLSKFPMPQPWSDEIAAARGRLDRVEALLAALREMEETNEARLRVRNDRGGEEADAEAAAEIPAVPQKLRDLFDVRLIRANRERFAPCEAALADFIRRELLAPEAIGLRPAEDGQSLAPVEEPEGHYRIRWQWPEAALADQCIVAVCPERPGDDDDPECVTAHWRAAVSREEWIEGGSERVVPMERSWEGSCLVVWAVIDTGLARLHTRPLVLAQLESRSRWKWPRIFS